VFHAFAEKKVGGGSKINTKESVKEGFKIGNRREKIKNIKTPHKRHLSHFIVSTIGYFNPF